MLIEVKMLEIYAYRIIQVLINVNNNTLSFYYIDMVNELFEYILYILLFATCDGRINFADKTKIK